jgi:citrate/tricarballylate utilization protein
MSLADFDSPLNIVQVDGGGEPGPLDALLADAARQLDICNACRYCEGLCAVFPALERRAEFGHGDVSQLANLCHDCRACFDACMYSPPHEFAVDLPQVLSAVRVADYSGHVWPPRVPRWFSGWRGLLMGSVLAVAIVLAIAVAHAGWSGLVSHSGGASSPYRLIPHGALVALMLSAAAYSAVVMGAAGVSYWRHVGGAPRRVNGRAVAEAVWYAMTLRYLRGGGQECFYPDDEQPSAARRHLHGMVAYGFGLCLVSTIAAAVEQDILGTDPPYPWLSVPVLAGTVGGVALALGCIGLIALKTRSSEVTSFAQMTVKDYGLLVALTFLALTGIAVLLTRDTGAYGVVLLIHLSALVEAFAMAPYSKFVHVVFRFLALVRDNLEHELA